MKVVSEEHAEDWVLIFSPLAEVAPSLQASEKAKSSVLSGVRAHTYNPEHLDRSTKEGVPFLLGGMVGRSTSGHDITKTRFMWLHAGTLTTCGEHDASNQGMPSKCHNWM